MNNLIKERRELIFLCEKFINSNDTYAMKIVLPQLLEKIETIKSKSILTEGEDGILDKLSGWFKGPGMSTIWETIIKKILNGMGLKEGFLRDTIEVVLSNSKWHELPGIVTNCNKFGDLIITQLPEIAAKYVARQFVEEDMLTTALRKSLIDAVSKTEFANSLRPAVREVTCDAMGWVGKIGSGFTDKVKGMVGYGGVNSLSDWKKTQYQGTGSKYAVKK
jgi:hypothetical protein